MSGTNRKYKSIRIPLEGYNYIKSLSQANHRSIVAEIMLMLDKHKPSKKLLIEPEPNEISDKEFEERKKALNELCGIIDDLPPGNYSETIDDVLYGGDKIW